MMTDILDNHFPSPMIQVLQWLTYLESLFVLTLDNYHSTSWLTSPASCHFLPMIYMVDDPTSKKTLNISTLSTPIFWTTIISHGLLTYLESFSYSLRTTTHFSAQVHLQVPLPLHSLHAYMTQQPVEDCFFLHFYCPHFFRNHDRLTLGPHLMTARCEPIFQSYCENV